MSGHCACFKAFLRKQNEQPSQPSTNKGSKSSEKKVGGNNSQQHGTTNTRQPRQVVFPSTMVPSEELDTPPNMELKLPCGVLPIQEESRESGNESRKRGKPPLWNPKFQKKRRTKLLEYTPTATPSTMKSLTTELQEASRFQRLQDKFEDPETSDSVGRCEDPRYDELFIYEKCHLIPPNEIGLGAMFYSPASSLQMSNVCEPDQTKTGNSSEGVLADSDCASSSMLFDVPIHGPSNN